MSVEKFHIIQFTNRLEMLVQQRGSKIAGIADQGSYTGKSGVPVNQIGATQAKRRTGKLQPMGQSSTPHDRRWVYPEDWDTDPDFVDQMDVVRMLTDPQSKYVINQAWALGRARDDAMIAAFFADARTGEDGTDVTAFPASQVVGVNVGGTGAGLNVEKLRAAKVVLGMADVDLDVETPNVCVTEQEHDHLLGQSQVVSTEFNDRPVLVDGKLTRFLGFNIHRCNRLQRDGNNYRRVPAWVSSGMHNGVWAGLKADVGPRRDLQGVPTQIYSTGVFGSTRLEEKKVVEIKCVSA